MTMDSCNSASAAVEVVVSQCQNQPSASAELGDQSVDLEVVADGQTGDLASLTKQHSDARESLLKGAKTVLSGIFSPGMLACLADTDGGCLMTAAQSGSEWGYSMLWLQVGLIPILFMAQELTARLGVHTQMGHTACIRHHYGRVLGWVAAVPLVLTCAATLISELAACASVGELWGMSRLAAVLVTAAIILLIVFCCKYHHIECIGVAFGLFELTFVVAMFLFHPSPSDVFLGSVEAHAEKDFFMLVAANIGAVVMPWMIYFQQTAVVARGLSVKNLPSERASTFIGCVLTQLIMIATMISVAAASSLRSSLQGIDDIVAAMEPKLGLTTSKVLTSLAFVGGSLCAAFVITLAASWSLCEAAGVVDKEALSLNVPIRKAKLFYCCFVLVVCTGVAILLAGVDYMSIMESVLVMDALLMPLTVSFLFFLSTGKALPEEVRVKGWRKFALGAIFATLSLFSIGSTVYGLIP